MPAVDSRLLFVIPVRHHDGVGDWTQVVERLSWTLKSIAAQESDAWDCVVVADHATPLPEIPSSRIATVRDHLPGVDLPPSGKKAERRAAIRSDKGRRVLSGLLHGPGSTHVMVVDYDDFVSRRLASFVARSIGPGWYVESGYVWSGGRFVMQLPRFDRHCGTSLILDRRLLPLEEMDTTTGHPLVDRWLGSHVFVKGDWLERNHPLEPLPFPAAVYTVGTGSNVLAAEGIRSGYFNRTSFRRAPLETTGRLRRLRLAKQIGSEFCLPLGA
jgi:hypothetical protein